MSKLTLILVLVMLCLVVFVWVIYGYANKFKAEVKVGDKVNFEVEVVSDFASQAQGLSGRESLPENGGMLFIYDRPAMRYFWMKDMNFSLDFIWIRDFKIVALDADIPHPAANDGQIYRLKSADKADMVLEVETGTIAQYRLEIGDRIDLAGSRLKVQD